MKTAEREKDSLLHNNHADFLALGLQCYFKTTNKTTTGTREQTLIWHHLFGNYSLFWRLTDRLRYYLTPDGRRVKRGASSDVGATCRAYLLADVVISHLSKHSHLCRGH